MGYLKRHWKGENSLPFAYWVNLVLLGVLYNAILAVPGFEKLLESLPAWIAFVIVTFSITIWQMVGAWRSATNYSEQAITDRTKKPFWAGLAKFMVAIGVLKVIAAWAPVLSDFAKLTEVADEPINNQYYIQKSKYEVQLNGYINLSSVQDVQDTFREHLSRNTLVLNSPGGLISDAFELADFIEKNEINVLAKGECSSSCLLVLAAAKKAYVTPETIMQLHHPEAVADFTSKEMRESLRGSIKEYYDRFKRYGVPEKTLNALKEEKVIKISLGKAYNDYIVDVVWHSQDKKPYKVETYCKVMDCFKIPATTRNKKTAKGNGKLSDFEMAIIEETLNTVVKQFEGKLPKKIDEGTILNAVTAKENALTYHYKILVPSAEIDMDFFKSEMQKNIKQNVCGREQMLKGMKAGADYIYSYKDQDGLPMTTIRMTATNCS